MPSEVLLKSVAEQPFSAADLCASCSVVVLTRNAETHLAALLPRLQATSPAPQRVLFIDSRSTDRTAAMIAASGATLRVIDPQDFGHGRTRNLALDLCADSRHVVFLTHDALPVGADWLVRLLVPFGRSDVAVAFGRQLPRPGATIGERFARLFNYPDTQETTTEADLKRRGIKAVFCSNSFAAYDRAALRSIGGFPEDLPMGEDMAATLRLLRAGHARAYCAAACAIHSHNYTLRQEFGRYFDIGVLLDCDPELRQARVAASGEGKSILLAEMRYARAEGGVIAMAGVLARAVSKLTGFQLGRHYRLMPRTLCRWFSMHSYYWGPT